MEGLLAKPECHELTEFIVLNSRNPKRLCCGDGVCCECLASKRKGSPTLESASLPKRWHDRIALSDQFSLRRSDYSQKKGEPSRRIRSQLTGDQMQLSLELIPHRVGAEIIQQRAKDGYINATAMCKAANREFKHYNENRTTKAFVAELAGEVGIPTSELIQSLTGGHPHLQDLGSSSNRDSSRAMAVSRIRSQSQ
jgi:hypothetical protein